MKPILLLNSLALLTYASKGQNLRHTAATIREGYQIPALAYAIVTPDSIVEYDVIGYHRTGSVDAAHAAAPADYFHIGSNTKAVTGFVAAYLVEKGIIDWNTKFFDLFPTWREGSNPAFHGMSIVICNSAAAKAVEGSLLLRDKMIEAYGRRQKL